jgi:zinc/manganese transport system substrate-binding protein
MRPGNLPNSGGTDVKRRTLLFAMPLAVTVRAAAATPPRVVASFSVLGDMVQRIAGSNVALTTIVGPDGDTEAYEPTASDAPSSPKPICSS